MIRTLLAVTALSLVFTTPALARHGRDDSRPIGAVNVSSEQAVAIARERGMTRLHEVKLDDGVWEVEGWTEDGRKIELDIHPSTGAVLKLEYYSAPR